MFVERWENRPEVKATPGLIEDFKRSYEDHSLSLKLISGNFGPSPYSIHDIARRLGCKPRPIRVYERHAKDQGTSVLEVEDEIERLKNQLATLEQKKLDLTVRAERQGSYIRAFGLAEDVLATPDAWVRWLKAGGPQKVRQLLTEVEWTAS